MASQIVVFYEMHQENLIYCEKHERYVFLSHLNYVNQHAIMKSDWKYDYDTNIHSCQKTIRSDTDEQ